MKEQRYEDASVYLIDLNKISPNPFQPRREFADDKLVALSNSIKQYGVLQPIVLTRKEYEEDSKIKTRYELIAGERRFRASKLAGLEKIPAIIREGDHSDKEKFELAIIENLQREDLNPVDKARAFEQLIKDFNLTHAQVAEKMSKSREFVSNSLRILKLPDYILEALEAGEISEGHTRPLLMLIDKKDEQEILFNKIIKEQITVRAAERYARNIAVEKVRKKTKEKRPEIIALEKKLEKSLGTRVQIESNNSKGNSGKVTIEYFSKDDLDKILDVVSRKKREIEEISLTKEISENNFKKVDSDENNQSEIIEKEEVGVKNLEKEVENDFEIDEIENNFDNSDDLYSVFDDDFSEGEIEFDIDKSKKEDIDWQENKTIEKREVGEKENAQKLENERIEKENAEKRRLELERIENERIKSERIERENTEKLENERREKKEERVKNENIEKDDLSKTNNSFNDALNLLKKNFSNNDESDKSHNNENSVKNNFQEQNNLENSKTDETRSIQQRQFQDSKKEEIVKENFEEKTELQENKKTLADALKEISLKSEELRQKKADEQKINSERLERENTEKRKLETERIEKEKLETERIEKEKLERERVQKERDDKTSVNLQQESVRQNINQNINQGDVQTASTVTNQVVKPTISPAVNPTTGSDQQAQNQQNNISTDKKEEPKKSTDKDDFFRKLLEKRRKEREEIAKKEKEEKERKLKEEEEAMKPAWSSWEDDEVEAESGNPILAQLLKKAQEKSRNRDKENL